MRTLDRRDTRSGFGAPACCVGLASLWLSAAVGGAAPFTMHGWQFHEYDVPNVSEAIRRAPQYGVNLFIFSHGLFDNTEIVLNDPQWVKDLQHLGAQADRQKIPWYLWTHEFDNIPERLRTPQKLDPDDPRLSQAGIWFSFRLGSPVDMDDPALWEYLNARYERLFSLFPTTAGLVLTFHESDRKIFRNGEVLSKQTVPERIVKVTRFLHEICRRHRKKLILRDFFYEPKEMEYFKQAIPNLPDDVILMGKDTVHEFQPFYPPDPMHGQVGRHPQIMELDTGVEKALSSQGHYAQVDYIRRYVQRAREKGMAGAVGRAHFFGAHPWDDTHDVNLYALSRFLKDPELGVDTVLQDWARQRYPAEAVPHIASALKRTEFIHHRGRYFLGFWLTRGLGGDWEDYVFYFNHLLLRSQYKWTKDPADKQTEQALYQPDRATFDKLVAEKDEVVAQARASLADMRLAHRYLTREQSAPLDEGFRFLLDAALLQKEWTRAYFGMRMYMKAPSDESRPIVGDALAKLEAMGDGLRASATGARRDAEAFGRPYQIDPFVLEMRWRMANRRRALEEDARVLKDTALMMEVQAQ